MEALDHGFAEGIALGPDGMVSEGSGQNVFLVSGGTIVTPPSTARLLAGITRDSILRWRRTWASRARAGRSRARCSTPADELFLTGTASEVDAGAQRGTKLPVAPAGAGRSRTAPARFRLLRGAAPESARLAHLRARGAGEHAAGLSGLGERRLSTPALGKGPRMARKPSDTPTGTSSRIVLALHRHRHWYGCARAAAPARPHGGRGVGFYRPRSGKAPPPEAVSVPVSVRCQWQLLEACSGECRRLREARGS